MADKAPATLQQLQDWARRSEIPGTAILKDRDDRLVAAFSVLNDELMITTSFVTDQGKTLADLLAFAADGRLSADIPLALFTYRVAWEVLGFGSWEQGPGEWYVTLETVSQAR